MVCQRGAALRSGWPQRQDAAADVGAGFGGDGVRDADLSDECLDSVAEGLETTEGVLWVRRAS